MSRARRVPRARVLLASTLAGGLIAGAALVLTGGPSASALTLGGHDPDTGVGSGLRAHLAASDADSAVLVAESVCLADDETDAVVEITAISTADIDDSAAITGFGIYELDQADGVPTVDGIDGTLADAPHLTDRTTRVERPCSQNGRDAATGTYLVIELSREPTNPTGPGEYATVDDLELHFTVDGDPHTRSLTYSYGFCSPPTGVDPASRAALEHCGGLA